MQKDNEDFINYINWIGVSIFDFDNHEGNRIL